MGKMEHFYALVQKRSKEKEALLATVTEGSAAGEKVFVENGKIRSQTGTFFTEAHMQQLHGKGLQNIEGQEVFVQPLGNQAKLVICGAGHVATALIRMAKLLDFEIVVLEDRPFFAEGARREGADQVFCGDYVDLLRQMPGSTDHYFVCMTRGHRFDQECLLEIFKMPHAYIGMMGSKKRSFLMKKDLVEAGFAQELIDTLHAPIGLSIGAQTPAEIALSVMSEIVKVRSEHAKETALDEKVLEELAKAPEQDEQKMLCTIIEKHGSAPRSAGTQMVVTSLNRVVGTIGGGCAEAEVITACREHFYKIREGVPHPACEKIRIRMTTDNAEEEGMVCGGTILVLLEEVDDLS